MKVGDLRAFNTDMDEFYANRLFVVTYVSYTEQVVRIIIVDSGETDYWDRISLIHDSKKINAVKKCP